MRSDYKQAFSNLFRPELESQGITVSDPSAVTEAIAELANREVIARIHLLCNRMDSLAWATLFCLKKGIGMGFINSIYSKAREDSVTFAEALTDAGRANFDIITPVSRQRTLNLFNEIVQWLDRYPMPNSTPEGNWGKWIISIVDQDHNLEISDYFRQLLLDLDEVLDEENSLDRYVSQIAPIGQDLAQTRSAGVRLMTMTSSKGLTVKATIVVGVENGLIPHPLAKGSEDRRLLYVAMTRPMEFLYLTWARRRTGPTARLGRENVSRFRNPCPFLSSGPITNQDGNHYLQDRFG